MTKNTKKPKAGKTTVVDNAAMRAAKNTLDAAVLQARRRFAAEPAKLEAAVDKANDAYNAAVARAQGATA